MNLAKLAARGFTIIFSSGDSGSGYVEGDSGCKAPDVGKGVSGTVLKSFPNVPHMYMCCNEAHGEYAPGWSCVASASPNESSVASPPPPAGGCGTCTLYSSVTGRPDADNTTQSSVQAGRVQVWASWPASSPWVTAVGGTRFADRADIKSPKPQVAVDEFGSGGGFSTMYKQAPHATWQEAAVARYLRTVDKATLPPAGSIGFDPLARGTPDVSVLAEGYNLIAGGATHIVGGTSAAAPAFAALVSLMNEARATAGKPPMGFLNPFLYSMEGEGFTDVTIGSNKRDRAGTPWPFGYNCSKGWDPVTGLGTPIFPKLLAAAMKLDDGDATAASATAFALGSGRRMPRMVQQQRSSSSSGLSTKPSTANCTWKYYTQPLSHFSEGSTVAGNASFSQRVCIIDQYWRSPSALAMGASTGNSSAESAAALKGPILFYTGNESPIDEYALPSPLANQYLLRVVLLKHPS